MHCGSKVRYFFGEFDHIFFVPKSGRKYSQTNSYNIVVIWAISWFDVSLIKYRKPRGWNLILVVMTVWELSCQTKRSNGLIQRHQRPTFPFLLKTVNHVDKTSLAVIMIVWEVSFQIKQPLPSLILHIDTIPSLRKICASLRPTKICSVTGCPYKLIA